MRNFYPYIERVFVCMILMMFVGVFISYFASGSKETFPPPGNAIGLLYVIGVASLAFVVSALYFMAHSKTPHEKELVWMKCIGAVLFAVGAVLVFLFILLYSTLTRMNLVETYGGSWLIGVSLLLIIIDIVFAASYILGSRVQTTS